MKNVRQNTIIELILENDIETQNQLIDALAQAGIYSTQATVSRDIKELHIIKELSPEGKYRYALAHKKELQNHSARLKAIFRESVTSCVCAQNMIIIKTLPGLASAACSALDGMSIDGLVGTIAGDDTAFLAMRDNNSATTLYREIEQLI